MATQTLANRFIQTFGVRALSDEQGMAALKWMNDMDPKGHGSMALDKETGVITFVFTDESRLILDTETMAFNAVQ